jgi:hypothetical protein
MLIDQGNGLSGPTPSGGGLGSNGERPRRFSPADGAQK